MSTGLPSQYPRLVADIGGTYARFALVTAPGVLEEIDIRPCAGFDSLQQAVQDYLDQTGVRQVEHAGFGIATAVTGDRVCMTNHHWQFSIEALRAELGFKTLRVVNDFAALALSLPHLTRQQLRQVGGGEAVADCPLALIGPGTGLGVSGLIPSASGWVPLSGEGGHVAFAPQTDEELAILRFVRARFEHVSTERLLSGPGLALLHLARTSLNGTGVQDLSAAEITRRALGGQCAQCRATLDVFCAMLGSAAAALALTLGARGGVYIGGGIVPRLGDEFRVSPFRERFERAGRLSDYLAQIPVFVIECQHPGLIGVAALLASFLREQNHA